MIATLLMLALLSAPATASGRHTLTISGRSFRLDGGPFPYTGLSFFNAIYNPAFNRDSATRRQWLGKFQSYSINVIRVWAQWDNGRGFADGCPECSLYFPDGRLRQPYVDQLKRIASDADAMGMVVELTLFSQESWHANIRLGHDEADRAVAALTREMLPYRNVIFQIWNEFSERTIDHVHTIKTLDPARIVTSSPGVSGVLTASIAENDALDYLSPHTSRQVSGRSWEIAPAEISYLIKRFNKPVVDDEPARNGTPQFGGPPSESFPVDHILEIYQVWQAGGFINYHHDMFQTGYGSPAVPPSGIPDPEFSPYHKTVLDFIRLRDRFAPESYGKP